MGFARQEYWSGVPLPSPDTIDQVDLIDIYRTFHPKTMNFTFSSSAHGTFSRIDHILGHKSSLGKFKKTVIMPIIFSDHNAVRLHVSYELHSSHMLVAKSRTWLSDFTFIFHFHALEKEMATHSSILAWRIPGMGEPGGLPSIGSHRVRHDWSELAAAAAAHASNVQNSPSQASAISEAWTSRCSSLF